MNVLPALRKGKNHVLEENQVFWWDERDSLANLLEPVQLKYSRLRKKYMLRAGAVFWTCT